MGKDRFATMMAQKASNYPMPLCFVPNTTYAARKDNISGRGRVLPVVDVSRSLDELGRGDFGFCCEE